MPHIIIEYSDNLSQKLCENKLLRALHEEVINHGIDAYKIKTRLIKLSDYIVGDGESADSMVHVTLLLLPGRGEEFTKTLGRDFHAKLESTLKDQGITKCSTTLEMREMKTDFYFK